MDSIISCRSRISRCGTSVPTCVPSTGIMVPSSGIMTPSSGITIPSSGIMGPSSPITPSESTPVLHPPSYEKDIVQSAVRRFLNDAELHDNVLSGMDADTVKSLQTDAY